MKFYVYELVDPRTDQVFYVGKGQRNRIHAHEVEARKGRQSRKCTRIREIEEAGLAVLKRKVSHHQDENDAYEAEATLVLQYGLENLTNLVLGGKGGRSPGHNTYEDRHFVATFAGILRRTGGQAPTLRFREHILYLEEVFHEYRERIFRIGERRGLDWVNAIASRRGVNFIAVANAV